MLLVACTASTQKPAKPDQSKMREKLIELNKQRIAAENEDIDAYIQRRGYKMETTETGLRYLISQKGSGEFAQWMNEVKLKYKLELLDGSYCYSSDSSGVLDLKLGQSEEPTGLQEGILKLNTGSKALVIVPSYLAYGITGDGNKIIGQQSLVYHIELIAIRK